MDKFVWDVGRCPDFMSVKKQVGCQLEYTVWKAVLLHYRGVKPLLQ